MRGFAGWRSDRGDANVPSLAFTDTGDPLWRALSKLPSEVARRLCRCGGRPGCPWQWPAAHQPRLCRARRHPHKLGYQQSRSARKNSPTSSFPSSSFTTAKPPLRRSSACNTPNGAEDAAEAAPPAGAVDGAADAASPGVPAVAEDAPWSADAAVAASASAAQLAAPAAPAAAASHGVPASSARLARIPIALKDAVRRGLTGPGEPRFVCGAFRVVCGSRAAAGPHSPDRAVSACAAR